MCHPLRRVAGVRFAAGALAIFSSCRGPTPETGRLVDLDPEGSAFRTWFDAHEGAPRAAFLLSPT